jgi:SAM-dependent methyltransferase
MAIAYTSLPSVHHFQDDALAKILAESFADWLPDGRGWRPPTVDRKFWEVAMAVRTLSDHGALRDDSEILGVGAGREWTNFLLTSRCRRVFATDLYLDPGTWDNTASIEMLTAPERLFSGDWNPERLVVQHMNALDLRFADACFDGIFSSSSIEHFGDHSAIRRAAEEMCRVLRPGGVCSISTEFRLAGPQGFTFPDTYAFTVNELADILVAGLDWDLIGDLDLHLDDETGSVEVEFAEAAADIEAGHPRYSTYPHLILRNYEHRWTSVHLALKKRAGP